MQINSHEDAARWNKAQRLVSWCRDAGFDHDAAAGWAPEQWELAAFLAGVKPPSGKTIRLVVNFLTPSGHELPADPFQGISQ